MLQYSLHLLEAQETFVQEYKTSFGSLKYVSNLIGDLNLNDAAGSMSQTI